MRNVWKLVVLSPIDTMLTALHVCVLVCLCVVVLLWAWLCGPDGIEV